MIFNISKQWALVLTAVALWLSFYVEHSYLDVLGYFSIATLGLLHGSNDLHILKVMGSKDSLRGLSKYGNYLYILAALFVVLIFLWFPFAALYFFILMSSYHFGEQHYEYAKGKRPWRGALFLAYGLFLFSLLFYAQYVNVNPIFEEVSGRPVHRHYFLWAMWISGGLYLVFWWMNLGHQKSQYKYLILDLFILGVLFVVFRYSSLVWGFCVYFILWHSIPSLNNQISFLRGEANWTNTGHYLRTAWPYWLLSAAGLAVMWYLGNQHWDHMLSILIFFLAAVTFPHVLVMTRVHGLLRASGTEDDA